METKFGRGRVGHALHHQHLLLIRERTKLGEVLPDALLLPGSLPVGAWELIQSSFLATRTEFLRG